MLENPQKLINLNLLKGFAIETWGLPDAIYIPCRNRFENLNVLIESIPWFKNPIILLYSGKNDLSSIKKENLDRLTPVSFTSEDFEGQIKQLNTFKNSFISDWDLPLKRNFALLHAIKFGYKKILLIDDDITGISHKTVTHGILALETNDIVGSLIEGFPDTSVIGHIEQKYGEEYHPFLSGSFLFINSHKVKGFFPLIYNEDWIFMVPSILNKKISAIGSVQQKEYDSFDSNKRIQLQEFGEIIAEGLFELIHRKKYADRFSEQFWNEYISYRRSYVAELLAQAELKYVPFLSNSLDLIKKITSNDCISFVKNWEEDIVTFEILKKNVSEKSIF